jgi:hypothetical protein
MTMIRAIFAIVVAILVLGACSEPMPSTQAMTDEQRCANAGGIWRANSLCEQPSGIGRR